MFSMGRKCPNCGKKELEIILDEWVCMHCEYHTRKKKFSEGTFR